MIITGFGGASLDSELEELIVNSRIGGLILFERNFENPEQLIRLVDDLQSLAMSEKCRQ